MSQADAPAADWYPDPSGRFQFRYWDGDAWTGHVSTDGKTDWDPPAEGDADAAAGQAQEAAQAVEPAAQAVDDSAYAPQAAAQAEEPAAAQEAAPEQAEAAQGGTIEEGEPSDTNLVANQRASLDADILGWVDAVAAQVEPRLSRIAEDWTVQPQAEAARACAYGLLVGHLAHIHPHMRSELSKVAEAHPSFTTLEAGARLDTLEQIAGDPQRTAAWLGPLIGTEDATRVQMLFD